MHNPYRQPSKIGKHVSNWNDLWKKLRELYQITERPRNIAVLDNFKDEKESICRKMGVVSPTDIVRMAEKLKAKK